MAILSNGDTWGTQLKEVKVEVTMRPAPYNDVDSIKLFDCKTNKEILLNQLNDFEQANLIECARGEIKSGRFGSDCQSVKFGGFIP